MDPHVESNVQLDADMDSDLYAIGEPDVFDLADADIYGYAYTHEYMDIYLDTDLDRN